MYNAQKTRGKEAYPLVFFMKKRGFSQNTSDVLTKIHRYNRINIKKHPTSDVSKKKVTMRGLSSYGTINDV